jgi:Caspase domain/Sel1 repeat
MMKSPLFRLVGLAFLMVILTPCDSASVQERRTALIIGNSAYKSSPLVNPVNDANDMAAVLKKLGFSVRLKINADQRSMESSIRAFGKELRSGGVGLFYFAGHGLQVDGRNYLIPIDAHIESEADVKYESVDAGRVLSQMYEAENGLNIVILDACRDNPYARSFRSSEKGLAKMDAPTGSILAYATAPGSVAADGTDRNGLYTSMLLKHMIESNLVIERVFKKVRIDVINASGNRQVPWELSSLTGDFYFYSKRGIVVKKQTEVESKKPIKETPKYVSISPESGDAETQFSLGHSYLYGGDGVPMNKAEALKWFRKAADQGHAGAQHNLGFMFFNGLGTPKNKSEAMNWYRKAAYQGQVKSQFFLGFMLHVGEGVPQNFIKAYAWYSLASAQGHEISKTNLETLSSDMTPQQIAQAQKEAAELWDQINK